MAASTVKKDGENHLAFPVACSRCKILGFFGEKNYFRPESPLLSAAASMPLADDAVLAAAVGAGADAAAAAPEAAPAGFSANLPRYSILAAVRRLLVSF